MWSIPFPSSMCVKPLLGLILRVRQQLDWDSWVINTSLETNSQALDSPHLLLVGYFETNLLTIFVEETAYKQPKRRCMVHPSVGLDRGTINTQNLPHQLPENNTWALSAWRKLLIWTWASYFNPASKSIILIIIHFDFQSPPLCLYLKTCIQ